MGILVRYRWRGLSFLLRSHQIGTVRDTVAVHVRRGDCEVHCKWLGVTYRATRQPPLDPTTTIASRLARLGHQSHRPRPLGYVASPQSA